MINKNETAVEVTLHHDHGVKRYLINATVDLASEVFTAITDDRAVDDAKRKALEDLKRKRYDIVFKREGELQKMADWIEVQLFSNPDIKRALKPLRDLLRYE